MVFRFRCSRGIESLFGAPCDDFVLAFVCCFAFMLHEWGMLESSTCICSSVLSLPFRCRVLSVVRLVAMHDGAIGS